MTKLSKEAPSNRTTGFTLIELLVVIAIIAILAAILFPVFTMAKEHSNQSKCLNNLKQLGTAMTNYRGDYDGYMPSAGVMNTSGCKDWCGINGTGTGYKVYLQQGTLFPYTKNVGVYLCGSDRTKFHNYAKSDDGTYPLSYSMNCEIWTVRVDTGWVKPLSKALLLIHEDAATINDGLFRPSWDNISAVHYNGTTVAYLDSHAAWKSKNALETEKASMYWTMNAKYQ